MESVRVAGGGMGAAGCAGGELYGLKLAPESRRLQSALRTRQAVAEPAQNCLNHSRIGTRASRPIQR